MSHSLSGLKPLRKLLGFTAQELADRIGVEVDSYRRLERGQRRIHFDKAIALAHHMGIPLEALTHEPTAEERVQLFKAGEQRRELLEVTEGDEGLAQTINDWQHDDDAPIADGGLAE